MAFKETILNIGLYVNTRGYEIIEQRNDYLKFNTEYLSIIYCYSKLEYVYTVWIGARNSKSFTEICDRVISEFFPAPFQELRGNLIEFLDAAINYLETEKLRIIALRRYTEKKNEEYTRDLLEKQKYAGMTVNERLYVSGLMSEYNKAVSKKNKQVLRHILRQLNLDDENIEGIISQVIK